MDDEALLDTLPISHRLALSYAPAGARRGVLALLALETRISGILRQQGETIIAQMKLAWWRDRFAQSPEQWPLGEPLLAILKEWPGDLSDLGRLVDGWEILLAEELTDVAIDAYATGRARGWAGLLGADAASHVEPAARQFALADLAVHMAAGDERDRILDRLQQERSGIPATLPRAWRSLAVLRALGLRAVDRQAESLVDGPGAMMLAMRVGITGR